MTKYNWEEVQAYYDEGHSTRECISHFKMSSGTLYQASKKGQLQTRQFTKIPLDEILTKDSSFNRGHLRRRLIKEGILSNKCAECGLGPEWQQKALTLALDHINGVRNDNRIENLRLLCPNCHSQTPTFAGRNVNTGS